MGMIFALVLVLAFAAYIRKNMSKHTRKQRR